MKTSARKWEELLWILGVHGVTSPLWRWLKGPRAVRLHENVKKFYSSLIAPGELVFDVGANVGALTEAFVALGAKVVAVEPNADCVRHIELWGRGKKVEVIRAAAGERSGVAVLNVSDKKDKMCSLSSEWIDAMQEQNSGYKGQWNRTVTVPTVTLDALIERYGKPGYIKIDVEGYEEQVLSGLSYSPRLLSFEFNKNYFESAMRCVEKNIFDEAQFNFTLVDPVKFELAEWVDRSTLKERLANLGEGKGLGDIFVKRS